MDKREILKIAGLSSCYTQKRMHEPGPGIQESLDMNPSTSANLSFQSNSICSSVGPTLPFNPSLGVSPHGVGTRRPTAVTQGQPLRRKRGRPRKYGPESAISLILSSSFPTPTSRSTPTQKRRGRPPGTGLKHVLASLGGRPSNSSGIGFTPHVITISVGEDITRKMSAFACQGPRSICILSAYGAISIASLVQPSISGGIVTYEGRFEILRLSGSYMLTDNGYPRSHTGSLSVSLSSPDGRVIGGGVGGALIAATTVQVVVGSFFCCSSKTESNARGRPETAQTLDPQTDNSSLTPTTFQPSPNPTSTSSMDFWSG